MTNKTITIDKKKALRFGGIITIIYSIVMASILSFVFYKFMPSNMNLDRLDLITTIFPLLLIILSSFLLMFIVMCDAYDQDKK
jgi:uncharacterized membrane-anchored protein